MTETELEHSLLRRFDGALETLAESRPRAYLLVTMTLAAIGYAWLLLFPWLVLTGVSSAYEAVTAGPHVDWSRLLIWMVVATGAALVTYHLASFRPTLPAGAMLDRKKVPALFVLINELRQQYHAPWIDRVMISGEFELRIVKTPYCGLPLWSTRTLMIGLPLAQSLSPTQFRCELARRLGQDSRRHNPLVNWLAQLRWLWPLYTNGTKDGGPGFQPIRWFFKVFAPLYARVSLPVARLDELAADSCAMETCSDEEVLDTITTEAVCHRFIIEKYWPTYQRLTARVREVLPKPHAGMAAVLRTGLQGEKYQEWLMVAINRESRLDESMPSLRQRVDNIGHRKPATNGLGLAAESAVTVYFGPAGEELDAALELALPPIASSEKAVNTIRFQPGVLISSMTRWFRPRRPDTDTATAREHQQATILQ
jgi:hypothetical protein